MISWNTQLMEQKEEYIRITLDIIPSLSANALRSPTDYRHYFNLSNFIVMVREFKIMQILTINKHFSNVTLNLSGTLSIKREGKVTNLQRTTTPPPVYVMAFLSLSYLLTKHNWTLNLSPGLALTPWTEQSWCSKTKSLIMMSLVLETISWNTKLT